MQTLLPTSLPAQRLTQPGRWAAPPRRARLRGRLLTLLLLLTGSGAWAQTTTLLNETFETGNSFTLVNGSATCKWVRNTAAETASPSVAGSTNSLYVSNSSATPPAYTYSNGSSTVHAYQDVTVPAGEPFVTLSFSLKVRGEGSFDYLRVSYAPTTFTPTASTSSLSTSSLISGSGTGTPATLANNLFTSANPPVYTTYNLTLPSSLAGTSFRLIFTWTNDNTTANQPPAAIDNVVLTSRPLSPLSGDYTINNTQVTAGRNFASFTAAINALNLEGVGGPVMFSVSNNQTFAELPPVITATGTSTNTITFQEATPSASLTDNPRLTPTGTSGSTDAGFVIAGGDYFTFDGINVDASAVSNMEFGYLVRNGSATNGASNNTIRNASIRLNRSNTSSVGLLQSSNSSFGGATTPTAGSGTNQNNTYSNLTITNAYSGAWLMGASVALPELNNQLAGCTIGDGATANDIGNGTSVPYGIRSSLQSRQSIFGNTVQNVAVNTTFTSPYGILIDQAAGTGTDANNVYGNKVSGIRNLNASTSSSAVYGIYAGTVTSGIHTLNLYNNFVWDLTSAYNSTTTASATRLVRGIYLASSGASAQTLNVSYNSVRLETPATYTASSACFEISSTSGAVINTRNNIFANFSTGPTSTTAKHYAWVSTSATLVGASGSVSDYNDLFIANQSGTHGFVGLGNATTYTELTDWRTATGQDANSVSANPVFVSATNLHVQDASPLNNIGTPIGGITTDIDGETRNGATPDIGGDEFTPQTTDVAVTAINGPVAPFAAGAFPVTFTLANNGSSTVTSVEVNYTLNGATTNLGFVTLTTPLTSGQTAAVSLGTLTFGSGQTSLSVSAVNPNGSAEVSPANTTNNTLAASFRPALCGTYNVGSAGDFATLDDAAAALNLGGASCAVTFLLTDASYAASGGITINQFPGNSGTVTLTIKPAAGASPTLTTTSAATFLLKLNGTDYVTLDGSNNGGTSRDLTLSSGNTTTVSTLVQLVSQGVGAGATNVTLKNLNFVGGVSTAGLAIAAGGASAGSAGADNDNLLIQNNSIQKVFNALYVGGSTATSAGGTDGLSITGNLIGPATAGTNNIGANGMFIANAVAPVVTGNTVQNVSGASNSLNGITFTTGVSNASVLQNVIRSLSATGSSNAVGLNLGTGFTGGVVDRNQILNLVASNTDGYAGKGIVINTGSGTSNLRVSNNTVAGLNGSGWNDLSSDAITGITIGGSTGGVTLVYNSVNLTGTVLPRSSSSGADATAALYVGSSATALDIRNNILVNTLVSPSTGAAKSYAFYSSAAKTAFTSINYNDYYVAGAQGVLGNIGGTGSTSSGLSLATLAAFQANNGTGQDANSINVAPPFVSATDLHLDNTSPVAISFDGKGTPVAGITTDLDGDTRNASTPDIGADEFSLPLQDVGIAAVTAPAASNCYSGSQPITVTIRNYGSAATTNNIPVSVTLTFPDASTTTLTATYSGAAIAAGGTVDFTVGNYTVNGSGTYLLDARTAYSPDPNAGNDALAQQSLTVTVPDAITITAAPTGAVCAGSTVTLTASSTTAYTYSWTSTTGGSLQSTTGATVTATPTQTTTYTVTGVSGGCTITQTITITVTPAPVVTVTPPSSTICNGGSQTLTASGPVATVTIGTGTGTTSNTGKGVSPYGLNYKGARTQYLVLASELTAAGFAAGDNLTSLAFNVAVANTVTPTNYPGFTIRLANTAASALTTTFISAGLTQVVAPADYTPVTGLNTHAFSAPFAWTGGNVLVDVSYYNSADFSRNSTVTVSTTTFNSVATYQDDSNTSPATRATADAVSTSRPNIQFTRQTEALTFSWTLVSGNGLVGATNTAAITVTPTQTSVYQVTATNPTTNCTATVSTTVTVNPRPTATASATPATIDAGQTTAVSFAFTGTGPFTFTYTNGTTPVTVTASAANPYIFTTPILNANTTYTVTALSDSKCTATADDLTAATTTVTVNQPAVDVAATQLLNPVAGNSCLTGPQPLTVRIQNRSTQPLVFASTPVTVTVDVTGAVTQSFSTVVNSGANLAVGDSLDVTLPSQLDMTTGGVYTFAVTATAAGDGNTTNDLLTPNPTRSILAPQAAWPFLEDFNAATTLPANWTATNFAVLASHGTAGSNGLAANLSSSTTTATATTPLLGRTTTATSMVTFDARFVDFTSYPATGTTLGASAKVDVQVSTCGGTFTTVYTIDRTNYNGTGTASTSFYPYVVPLTGVAANQVIQVRFVATRGSGNYFLDVDNVNVRPVPANDAGVVAIVDPVAPVAPAPQPVSVQVKNYGTAPLTSVTVNWTVNGTAQAPQTFTGLNVASGATSGTLSLGTFDFSTGGPTFTIVAATSLPNGAADGLTTNDSFTRTFTPALAGLYTVGTGQQFTTLTSAINTLNTVGVAGAVTFSLTDATYGTAETFPLTINTVQGGSATNTLTIKPAAGVTAAITGNNGTALLKLNGADYVTLDGSNTVGGTTRDLTLTNTSTTANNMVVWVASVSASNGATFNTLKNLNIVGTTTSSQSGIGVLGTATNVLGQNNDDNTIVNNYIIRTGVGINAQANTGQEYDNLVISGNIIGPNVALAADNIVSRGIFVARTPGVLVAGNTVQNVVNTGSSARGINIGKSTSGAVVERNIVRNVQYTGTTGYGARGISVTPGPTGSNITVRNNAVSGVVSDSDGSDSNYGIMGIGVFNGSGYAIYNNSVQLSGDRKANTYTGQIAAALWVDSAATGLDLRNNVLSNIQTSSNTVSLGTNYAVYARTATSPFSVINYNLYDVRSGEAARATAVAPQFIGHIGTGATTDYATLAAWQAATGQDNSSMVGNPGFTSASNLTPDPANPNSYNLNGGGVQIASISQDLTGATRSTTVAAGAPDLGAYEVTPTAQPNVLTTTGTYALGGTQSFFFNGRLMATITYGATGTLPTTLTARYYPGTNPRTPLAGARYLNSFLELLPSADGVDYTYDLVLHYDDALLGTVDPESALRLSRRDVASGFYQFYAQATLDATANTLARTGLTSFGEFTGSDQAAPLPVSLTSFVAQRQDANALLTWTTAQEKNNRGFEVQVSVDGRTFRPLGFVASEAPNSTTARHYRFVDAEAGKQGLRYYRLKQVDQDGKSAFFGPRTVQFEQTTKLAAVAFPNPFEGQALTLEITAPASAATELLLLDAVGRTVLRQTVNLQAGVQRLPLQLAEQLPAGAYVLRLTSAGQTSTLRVVKQ